MVLRGEFPAFGVGRVDGSRAAQFLLKLFSVYESRTTSTEADLNHWDALHM